jgi:hypothetical protein
MVIYVTRHRRSCLSPSFRDGGGARAWPTALVAPHFRFRDECIFLLARVRLQDRLRTVPARQYALPSQRYQPQDVRYQQFGLQDRQWFRPCWLGRHGGIQARLPTPQARTSHHVWQIDLFGTNRIRHVLFLDPRVASLPHPEAQKFGWPALRSPLPLRQAQQCGLQAR